MLILPQLEPLYDGLMLTQRQTLEQVVMYSSQFSSQNITLWGCYHYACLHIQTQRRQKSCSKCTAKSGRDGICKQVHWNPEVRPFLLSLVVSCASALIWKAHFLLYHYHFSSEHLHYLLCLPLVWHSLPRILDVCLYYSMYALFYNRP